MLLSFCPIAFLFALLLLCASLAAHADTVAPSPVARKVPKEVGLHGDRRTDDYFWLREKTNPDVAAYLEAENAYTAAVMAPTTALQEMLYREMLSHIKETDTAVPYRRGGHYYYSRTEEGKQYPIRCRRKGSLSAPEEILLDLNQMAEGLKFLSQHVAEVSDDDNLVAYTVDTTGFRQYRLHIKDLGTGKTLPDTAERVTSVAWAADNATLFYTVEDPVSKRSYRLYRHRIGDPADKDQLLYEEKDERFTIWVSRTRSKAYLLLNASSHTATEVRFLPADRPQDEWQLVTPRRTDHEYFVDHRDDRFYIRTNDRGRNFRLVTAPIDNPAEDNWKERIAHRKEIMLEGADLFANTCVLSERRGGLTRLRALDLRSGKAHEAKFPEPAYAASLAENFDFDAPAFRYRYQSPITPLSVFDHSFETHTSTLLKQTEVPGGFDRDRYVVERLQATAPDGVKVPISLAYRKGVKRDGTAPLLLSSYGSYGAPSDPGFQSNHLSLLDRGVVVAIAHIRGGGEMGKAWHDAGRMKNKRNTFTDFIACAEHLIAKKVAARDRIAISGGSAGGLLMGAVTNMRPDLFRAVLSYVPFVDVLNTMSDASLPLVVPEYEEWGNPNKPDEYDYMKSYCPYTNLEAKAYPAILVRTSFNDSQVMYWEPAKYVAKLRTLKTDRNPLLFKTNMAAGHGGASGRYDALRDTAHDYAFLLTQLGVAD